MSQKGKSNKGWRKRQNLEVHLEKWKRSGLTQAEYCRQNGLNQNSFSSMKNRVLKTKKSDRAPFIEIPVGSSPFASNGEPLFEFRLAEDFSLILRLSPKIISSMSGSDNVSG